MTSTLLTGASGFLGHHLARHLKEVFPGERLVSVGRHDPAIPGVEHFVCDLQNRPGVHSLVEKIRPRWVYHLAGASRVTSQIAMPEYFARNFLTTHALLSALAVLAEPVSFFLASSVHVYGNQEETVDEDSLPEPVNPYGFSKYLAEQCCRELVTSAEKLNVVVGRLYTCVGPGQPPGFVVSDLCRQLAQLGDGERILKTGPLGGVRRFLDARDAVKLFPLMLRKEVPLSRFEIFNVASPYEMDIRKLVELLLKVAGRELKIESSGSPASNPFRGLKLKTDKLETLLPRPEFRPFEQTLADTLDWARGQS